MTDDTIDFWHAVPSRGAIARWMLEEVGAPYRVHLLDLQSGQQRGPDFLAINPMGKVPAIRHRGVVVTEAGAVCAYLADAFPDAGLAPPPGDPARGAWYRWMFFYPGCVEPAVMDQALKREAPPRGQSGYGDFDTTMNVLAAAVSAGPFLLGDRFSAADVVLGSGVMWARFFGLIPDRPEFAAYIARLETRPALQRARRLDAAAKPGVSSPKE